MSVPKTDIVRFRLDLIPNLVERIWYEIGDYKGHDWDLPKDQSLLEKIVGAAETNKVYNITNSAEQNIYLRTLLSNPLKDEDYAVRLAAIEWVVYDWGNVRGSSQKHEMWPKELKQYDPQDIETFIAKNYKDRIASWSKVLSFADSATYAIYDAWVAMSLNALLDKAGYKQRFYMPPPSSPKLVKLFSNIKDHVGKQYAGKIPTYLGYFDYLDLLNFIVNNGLAKDILEVEMRLFAKGNELAQEYAKKYGISY